MTSRTGLKIRNDRRSRIRHPEAELSRRQVQGKVSYRKHRRLIPEKGVLIAMPMDEPIYLYPLRGQHRHIAAGPVDTNGGGYSFCQVKGYTLDQSVEKTILGHPTFGEKLVREWHSNLPTCQTCQQTWNTRRPQGPGPSGGAPENGTE